MYVVCSQRVRKQLSTKYSTSSENRPIKPVNCRVPSVYMLLLNMVSFAHFAECVIGYSIAHTVRISCELLYT